MNNLNTAMIGRIHGILDSCVGKTLLEKAMAMTAQDCLKKLLLLQPRDEIECGLVCLLLDHTIAPLLTFGICFSGIILGSDLQRDSCQICTVAIIQFQFRLAELRSV